jgi:hypothetical protein
VLYQLFFVTCLVGNSAHCVTRVHTFDDTIWTPQQCLTVAQPAMARWANAHADRWVVERFRCGKPPRDPGTVI